MKHQQMFVALAILVLLVDQLTKLLVRQLLSLNQSVPIIKGFLSVSYINNTGALFGLFKGNASVLAWLGVAGVALLIYSYKEVRDKKLPRLFYALVLAGVAGNIIDRFFFGAVTDFLDFSFWPAFNLADIAATAGVIGLVAYCLKKKLISS